MCDLGFLSLLTTESPDPSTSDIPPPLFQSDMIDHGLSNFPLFLSYVRKLINRLTIRAGKSVNNISLSVSHLTI